MAVQKQATEKSVEEAQDQQGYIFTNANKDMRKGLDWISSMFF